MISWFVGPCSTTEPYGLDSLRSSPQPGSTPDHRDREDWKSPFCSADWAADSQHVWVSPEPQLPSPAAQEPLHWVSALKELKACKGAGRRLLLNRSSNWGNQETFPEEVTFGVGLLSWIGFPFAEGAVKLEPDSSPTQLCPKLSFGQLPLRASVAWSGTWGWWRQGCLRKEGKGLGSWKSMLPGT